MKKIILSILFAFPLTLSAQQPEKGNLGDKEYVIIKDYKPVLGESLKISETPEGDTSSSVPPVMDYSVRSRKASTEFEASAIKAVKIKDEQLTKLYRSYARLGLGNYTTYLGDLYVNALRSKQGSLGLALNHHSGNPGFSDAGPAGFSKNHAGVYGKYFLDNSTFTGDINYDRDVVHYYGYDSDTVINKDDIKQRFSTFGMKFGIGSNYLNRNHLDYSAQLAYSGLSDLYDANENDFLVAGKLGKIISGYYFNAGLSFNYFKKTRAKDEILTLSNELSRSIVSFTPEMIINKERMELSLGFDFTINKDSESKMYLFPKINITLPIAEKVLYVFAGVNGGIVKNSYQTITNDNPFVTASIQPFNTKNRIELKGGIHGNFSQRINFMAMLKYSTMDDMLLYVNDLVNFNMFNVQYYDGKVLDIHAEVGYTVNEKFSANLKFDQYSYNMAQGQKAWHRPGSEIGLTASYNIWDKILIKAGLFSYGKYYAKQMIDNVSYTSVKVNGYADINLGIEYRYSKILSLFVNLNNLGFSKYYRWYNYPSEKFNVLGGLKVSF